MRIKTGEKGFTLIEVMIVIAILGILSSVALPLILASIPRYHLRAEVHELVINFKRAKVEAVKHNRDVVILFQDTPAAGPGGSYQMFVNVDRNAPPTLDAGDLPLVINKQIRPDMQLNSNFLNDIAGYNSRGLPLQISNVSVGTRDGARNYTLSVSSAGNVRVQ